MITEYSITCILLLCSNLGVLVQEFVRDATCSCVRSVGPHYVQNYVRSLSCPGSLQVQGGQFLHPKIYLHTLEDFPSICIILKKLNKHNKCSMQC
jgi:uncharacterized Zn-finger protein